MGKEHWAHRITVEKTPGPGQYRIPQNINESPRFTIKNRYKENTVDNTAQFVALPSTLNNKGKYFGPKPDSSSKNPREGKQIPGPEYVPPPFGAKYLNPRKNLHRESYDPRKKPKIESYSQNPFGPAEYNTRNDPSKPSVPQISIGSRYKERSDEANTPSPSDYHSDNEFRVSSPRYSIGQKHERVTREKSPGPGQYLIPSDLCSKPIYIHKKHTHHYYHESTPGPGQYINTKPFGSDSPRIKIKSSYIKSEHSSDTPYYLVPSEFAKKRPVTIGSSRRDDNSKSGLPGPGFYSPVFNEPIRGHTIAKADVEKQRFREFAEPTPGPGHYKPSYYVGKPSSPQYSLRDSYGSFGTKAPDGPGPGYYNNITESRSPRVAIKNRVFPPEKDHATVNASYYVLPSDKGPKISIHIKDKHDLIAE